MSYLFTFSCCSWDFQGKNAEVVCHFLLQCMKVKSESKVVQSCLTLSDPMDCSPPGSSVHGILQARVLEWVAISFSRGSSQPRDRTQVSCTVDRCFTVWATVGRYLICYWRRMEKWLQKEWRDRTKAKTTPSLWMWLVMEVKFDAIRAVLQRNLEY